MALRELKDEEEVSTIRPLGEDEEVVKTSFMGGILEGARQINIGLTEPFGLRPVANLIGAASYKEGDDELSPGQAAARGIGYAGGMAAATMAAPLAAAGRGVQGAIQATNIAREGVQAGLKPALSGFAQKVTETAVRNPITFAATEAGSAAAAGATGQFIEDVGGSPTTKLVGELVSGAGVAGAVPAVMALSKVSVVGQAVRSMVNSFKPTGVIGPGGARAAARVQRAVPDVDTMLGRAGSANVIPEARLTLGERAEEPGLLSLERSVVESSDELKQESQKRFAEINSIIRSSIKTVEPEEASLDDARAYLDNLVAERMRIAQVKVDEHIASLGPRATSEDANRLARVEIGRAYDAALEQERVLWDAVDEALPAPPSNTVRLYQEITRQLQENRVTAAGRHMPEQLKRFLGHVSPEGEFVPGSLSDGATVGELKELRSTLLQISRFERAKPVPNRRKISIVSQLEGELLKDLEAANPDDEALTVARAFSADLNNRFRKGSVGDLLGFSVEGAEAINPGLTLERTVGKAGMAGAMATDDLIRAVERTGNQTAFRAHVEDFLSDEFLRVTQRNGDFNAAAAQRYLSDRQDVLARFPELRRKFERALAVGSEAVVAKDILNPQVSAAAVVLKSPPGQEIDKLVRSPKPGESALEVKRLLETDETGRALPGMRQAFSEWLIGKSSKQALDANDTPFISGADIQDLMTHPGVKQVMDVLFTPTQMKRWEQIKNTALRIDRARKANEAAEGIIGDREGIVVEAARRIAAAATFRHIGAAIGSPNTVQIPSIGVKLSERMRQLGIDPARKLIIDAVTAPDDTLLRALLTAPTAQKSVLKQAQNRINAWVWTNYIQYGKEMTEEQMAEDRVQQALSVE